LRTAADVCEFILAYRPTLAAEEQEVFLALALNSKHRVTKVIEVAKGTLASVDVHPRDVYRPLILAASAATVVVHQHPSGDPEPSKEDLMLTMRLCEVGRLVGIPILDHVVIGGEQYVSLADRGLL
jgi:DNA repair protein RadC